MPGRSDLVMPFAYAEAAFHHILDRWALSSTLSRLSRSGAGVHGSGRLGAVMGYILEAVIGSESVLRKAVNGQPAAELIPLAKGIAMVPMTDKLFAAVTDGTSDRPLGFWKLPGGFERVLSDWSSAGPVGYVEAEYFGGYGGQRAALWVDGEVAIGPLAADAGQQPEENRGPISEMLRHLGVKRGNRGDEFDAVGLGRHRHTSEWLP